MIDHMTIAAKVLSPQELLAWTLVVARDEHVPLLDGIMLNQLPRSQVDSLLYKMGIEENECNFTDELFAAAWRRNTFQ